MQVDDVNSDEIDADLLLDLIADSDEPPTALLGLALLRIDDVEPRLLALLDDAADGKELDERAENLLFYGLHILGAGRRERAFEPLMRLLRKPDEALDRLLGDAITLTLPQIVAGAFNGDAASLMATIIDADVDPFVQRGLLATLAFLTWNGRIDAAETRDFLTRFDDDRLADEEGLCWDAWAEAIALLGWRDLLPRVEAACDDGRILPTLGDYEDFLAIAERAEAEPDNPGRFADVSTGYIEDIGTAFDWMPGPDEAAEDDEEEIGPRDYAPAVPVINPNRHVGRNDPCPCGSGKKYKKCCLAA